MTQQRISMITLSSENLPRARAFYAALGWQEHPGGNADVAFYQMNGSVFGLYNRAKLAEDQGCSVADLGTGAATLGLNFGTEAEVDAAFSAALAAGASAVSQPEKVFWGGYSGYYADLDGHVWEVAMNPFWPLAEDGSLTLPDSA